MVLVWGPSWIEEGYKRMVEGKEAGHPNRQDSCTVWTIHTAATIPAPGRGSGLHLQSVSKAAIVRLDSSKKIHPRVQISSPSKMPQPPGSPYTDPHAQVGGI